MKTEVKSWRSRLLGRLGRTTTSGLYIPEIDGLRSVAIVLVIMVHLRTFIGAQKAYPLPLNGGIEQWFYDVLSHGSFGVQLFFALSGFIIALPFAAHFLQGGPKVKLGRFYLRRLTRLEPPFLIALTLNAFIHLFVDHWPAAYVAERFAASSVYLHSLIYGEHSVILLLAWSLEIEFQFYFLAPLLLGVLAVPKPWLRRTLFIAGLVAIIALRPEAWRVEKSLLGKIEYFGVGILMADIYLTQWRQGLPRLRRFDVLAIFGWLALGILLSLPPERWNMLARPVALFAILAGSMGGIAFSALLRNAWVATFGGMCYTVYLYHSTVLAVMVRLTKRFTVTDSYLATYAIQFVLNMVAIVVIGAVLFALFEKPFMERDWPARWRQRWQNWRQRRRPQSLAAEAANG